MTAATYQSTTVTDFGSDATTHAANMPATVNAADLLLAIAAFDSASTTITTPTGWTRVTGMSEASLITGIYAKVADGTEDGLTVDFATNNVQRGSVHVIRASAWNGSLETGLIAGMGIADAVTGAFLALGTTTRDVLWILGQSKSSATTFGAGPPSGYANEARTGAGEDSTASASIVTATKTSTAAKEEAGTLWNTSFETLLIAVLP